jgi:6,7-dimethyl-8-ribityllumazine synthase
MNELRGSRTASGCRFAIVVSRFNEEITDGLLKGARQALADASVRDEDVTVMHVPGAFEIPVTALRAAETGRFDAVICIGCLIKGETPHFEYIAGAACQAIADAAAATGVPMALGVLTTLTEEQAMERAADGPGNKGREAALAAVEMATLFRQLQEGIGE